MPVVNPGARELVFKVVYYGPGLGGKTTSLQHIHAETKPEYRGDMVSLATPVDRTLYFDFLPIRVPSVRGLGVRLQLFTVPGQVYYNATRKLVLTGADGVVFVADSQAARQDANLESLENLRVNLVEQGRDFAQLPLVFQYNKRDLGDILSPEQLNQDLNPKAHPFFETVGTSGQGVFEALERITRLILADFERRHPSTPVPHPWALEAPEGGIAEALRAQEALGLAEVGPTECGLAVAGRASERPSSVIPELSEAEMPELLEVGEQRANAGFISDGEIGSSLSSKPSPSEAFSHNEAARGPVPTKPSSAPAILTQPGSAPNLSGSTPPSDGSSLAALGLSYASLFPGSQQLIVRQAEQALAEGRTEQAVELIEQLLMRVLAAAASFLGQPEAPRDPSVVALLLGLSGPRYLEFRGIARRAHQQTVPSIEEALSAYSFVVEARLAWLKLPEAH